MIGLRPPSLPPSLPLGEPDKCVMLAEARLVSADRDRRKRPSPPSLLFTCATDPARPPPPPRAIAMIAAESGLISLPASNPARFSPAVRRLVAHAGKDRISFRRGGRKWSGSARGKAPFAHPRNMESLARRFPPREAARSKSCRVGSSPTGPQVTVRARDKSTGPFLQITPANPMHHFRDRRSRCVIRYSSEVRLSRCVHVGNVQLIVAPRVRESDTKSGR